MGLVGGGVGLVIFGILVLLAGFFISGYTQDNVSQCEEWYGQLGQMLDSETAQSCQNASTMQAASQAGIIIGIILAVIGVVCLGIGLSRQKNKQFVAGKVVKDSFEKKPLPESEPEPNIHRTTGSGYEINNNDKREEEEKMYDDSLISMFLQHWWDARKNKDKQSVDVDITKSDIAVQPQPPQKPPDDAITKLERVTELREKGMLSEEEYQELRKKLLGEV